MPTPIETFILGLLLGCAIASKLSPIGLFAAALYTIFIASKLVSFARRFIKHRRLARLYEAKADALRSALPSSADRTHAAVLLSSYHALASLHRERAFSSDS